MSVLRACFARGLTRARERYATFAIERTIPASSASQPFESPVASSRAASSHARHAHVVLLSRSFIDTHTHAPTIKCVRPTTCPTDRILDVTRTRPLAPSLHNTSPAVDARRRRPPRTLHAHTRAYASFARAHARTSHHPTSIRPVARLRSPPPIASALTQRSPRTHRATASVVVRTHERRA